MNQSDKSNLLPEEKEQLIQVFTKLNLARGTKIELSTGGMISD